MFGYVRPVLDRMSEQERETYKSAYCGLCHAMGRRHGWLSRFTLNYDFTLLVLLFNGISGSEESQCLRCPAHPFKKPRKCFCGDNMDLAADESMILTWHKLSDDVADKGFLAGLPARFLRFLFDRSYRRAAHARPLFDSCVRRELAALKELELLRSPQLDRVADTFARVLAGAAAELSVDGQIQRSLEHLLYHTGRWIYLIDAWDDLGEDKKRGRYNPLDARFGGCADGEREYIETTMTHSVRLVHSAANLIDFGKCTSIIENIIFTGLPSVQTAVLSGQWKKLKKQRSTKHERPV